MGFKFENVLLPILHHEDSHIHESKNDIIE